MKLSHTAINKYLDCGMAFKLHYIDKLRPIEEPSALSFGSAIDKAFTRMLVPEPGDIPATPYIIFTSLWSEENILTENFKWSKSDLDEDLLTDLQKDMNEARKAYYSLRAKGLLMIYALKTKILPNIEKVYSVQEAITLSNEDSSGDEFIGFVDFIVQYKGYKQPIIMDLKTSSVVYTPESVRESQQLTVYTYALENKYKTRTAGFIVLSKKIKKNKKKTCKVCGFENSLQAKKCTNETVSGEIAVRCNGELITSMAPEAEVSVIIDEIPMTHEELIMEKIHGAHEDIKEGKFEQNFSSCIHPKYFTKCPYYFLCHHGKTDGLVTLDKKEKKE